MKKKLKIIAGILMIPMVFILFYADRLILLFLPWQNSATIQDFYKHIDFIIPALYRVIPIIIGIIFYNLIF